MTSDSDLIKLYSSRILALAADIPHLDRLEAPDATEKKRAPLCGSTITVDLNLSDGKITAFGQDVKACALGKRQLLLLVMRSWAAAMTKLKLLAINLNQCWLKMAPYLRHLLTN